jgi:hypothetical protein
MLAKNTVSSAAVLLTPIVGKDLYLTPPRFCLPNAVLSVAWSTYVMVDTYLYLTHPEMEIMFLET